ncbi:MAG: hypothetical protein RLZZ28_2538 [Bacteroidota bacterium]|jgi:hypothetical protein
MKSKLTLLLIILFTYLSTFCQKPAATTEEEYNYCVRGYRTMLTEGLDMKKGYHFESLFDKTEGNYSFDAKLFIRDDKKEVAAILIVAKSNAWGNVYYHCIPHDNERLLNAYWSDLAAWDRPMLFSFAKVMTSYHGSLIPAINEMQKLLKK